MLRRENILITEDYMSKTTSATHFTAPGEIECFDSSIHFGKESDRVEIQNCNIKNNVLVHCSKEDTYDFETGALIALMKMCGSDKVVRACNEAFSYETDIKVLRKDNNNLREANKGLQEEIKRLKGESESHWKKYQRNIQKKQDRINELNNIEEEYIKLREEYDSLFEENEKLQHEYNLCKNSENALKCSVDYLNKSVDKLSHSIDGYKNDLYNTAKRCKALEAENEKLKLDCEKLQHGYNDMMICGGRQNGKQYTALVNFFKKLDQKKVDAAYKEAYDKWIAQPIWQKEVFKQIQKDQLASLLEAGKYLYKIPTKREEMWEKIFELHKESDVIIKVKKEDVITFLHEIEDKIPEITWRSGVKIFELNHTIKYIYEEELESCDTIYFRLRKENTLSYSNDSYIYPYRDLVQIAYLPPMRWDLFKKGRIVVGVKNNNELVEFRKEVERNTGIKNIPMSPTNLCLFYSFDKDDYKIILVTIGEPNSAKINNHKVVYWEDVR